MPNDEFDSNPFAAGADSAPDIAERSFDPVALDIGAILGKAWEIFQANIGLSIGAVLIPAIVSGAFSGVQNVLQAVMDNSGDDGTVLILAVVSLAISAVGFVVNTFFTLGLLRIFIGLARGQDVDLGMLVGQGNKLITGLLASLLSGVIVVAGILLCVVPGVIAALGLMFATYLIVDRDAGVIDALQDSWAMTNGHKVFLLGYGLVSIVIIFAGLLAFCVGLLVAGPVITIGTALIYDTLLAQHLADE